MGRREVLAAAVVLLAFWLLCDAKFWRPDTRLTINENVQIAEAQAWWQGRLDLPERKWDTALYNDKVYSHFPPLFSILSATVVPFASGVPHWFIVILIVLPIPLLAFVVFRARTGSCAWGGGLAIALVCGTSLLPVLDKTLRGAHPYFVNQSLATIGMLMMIHGGLNRRSPWLSGLGLIVGALSRQMTIAYALPLFFGAWRQDMDAARKRRMAPVIAGLAVAVTVPMALNFLKFDNPLDGGYMHVYTGRGDDQFAHDARTWGLFSSHYLPRNLYYANLGFPDVHRIEIAGTPEVYLRPNDWGTGIWWTTPLLLWFPVWARRLWRDPATRAWLIAAGLVFVALMFYHSTGFRQRGFNRYSLDYIPVLLALIAPYAVRGWRRWLSACMIVWSIVYFAWLANVNIHIL